MTAYIGDPDTIVDDDPLVDQPSSAPTKKVQAVGISGAVATIIIFIAGQMDVTVDPITAAAFVTLISTLSGYFKRNKVSDA